MIKEARIAVFLAKAKEAQDEADKAKQTSARESWLKIAAGYNRLAKMAAADDL